MGDKISIIMPAYNAADRIEKAIHKIEQQSYKNFELIIVNDGSEDSTEDVCHALSEEYDNIKLISKKNAGPGKAREAGIAIASGDYIGFVDSDDYISQTAIDQVLQVFNNTNADIIQFGFTKVSDNDEVLSNNPMKEESFNNSKAAFGSFISQKNCTNFLWNKFYKRNLFKGVEWPGVYYSEDYAVLAQLYGNSGNVITIKDELYYYVKHSESAVNKPFTRRKLDQIEAAKYVINYTKKNFPEYLPEAFYYLTTRSARLAEEVLCSDLADRNQIYNDLVITFKDAYSEMKLCLKKQGRKIDIDKTTRVFAISPSLARILKRMR
jgi:glycosyltransferase involved in cell wall biosynthesis